MNAAPLLANSKQLARTLLTVGENRLELLMVELQEERERMLHAMVLALGVAAFGLLAGVAFTGAVMVCFWDTSPLLALCLLAAAYGVTSVGLYWRLAVLLRDWQSLSETLAQLRKDRSWLETCLT